MQRAAACIALLFGFCHCSDAASCRRDQSGTCISGNDLEEDVGLLQAKRTKAGEQHTYESTEGLCRGGSETWNDGNSWKCLRHWGHEARMTNDQCMQACNEDPQCRAYDRPDKSWAQQCCLFKRGYRGNGNHGRKCYVRQDQAPFSTPTPAPTPAPAPVPASEKYYPHFDTTADYLNIAARAAGVKGNAGSVSDNYYMVISDSGGCGGCGSCCMTQRRVAEKMQEYVAERKRRQPHSELLFVLVGGDNFYWSGASPGRFHRTWLDVYGPTLTSVPWFAALGNHDYGNDDPTSGCPDVRPRFRCTEENANTAACGGPRPYSTMPQAYDSNALNADKGGVDGEARRNWHQPDYTYFYTIPDLDFELLAIDWNVYQFNAMGGNGFSGGASQLAAHCGGKNNLYKAMEKVRDASTELLNNRSGSAQSKNIAIISHYPDWFQQGINLRRKYLDGMPQEKRANAKVFNFYGHTHSQVCDKKDPATGECTDFLTGAAGGCCGRGDVPAGFTALSWNEESTQVVECFQGHECTLSRFSVLPPRRGTEPGASDEEICSHTVDDPQCVNWTQHDN